MKGYLNYISRKCNYRMEVDAIAIPEFKNAYGEDTHIHYHCLISIPEGASDRYYMHTYRFWEGLGLKKFGAMIDCDTDTVDDSDAYLNYATKNFDDDYPLDRVLLWGNADIGKLERRGRMTEPGGQEKP